MTSLVERARHLAETRLAPAADEVDSVGEIPTSHFAELAGAGLLGVAMGPHRGDLAEVAETIVSGCLATGFVWAQHHGVAVALARAGRSDLVPAVASGELMAGVSYAGLTSHGRPLSARRADAGWILSGSSAFVTGWGIMDLIGVWAHDEDSDEARFFVIRRPDEVAGVTATRLDLVAARASNTVRLSWDGVVVDDDALVASTPASDRPRNANMTIRLNASLALGVCRSSLRHLDRLGTSDTRVADAAAAGHRALSGVRAALDSSLDDADALYRRRAEANDLATRLATVVAAATGSASALADSTAARLTREALFCAVCASRPAIRDEMVMRLLSEPVPR